MKPAIAALAILFLLTSIAGGAYVYKTSEWPYVVPSARTLTGLTPSSFALSDGSVRNYYEFVTDGGDGGDGVILFLTGSGCHSNSTLKDWFFRGLKGSFRILAMDKSGVVPGAVDGMACSPQFFKGNGLAADVAAQSEFANVMWARYPQARERILFGVSEGAWKAGYVAAHAHATTRVVLFSGQGGTGVDRIKANGEQYAGRAGALGYLALARLLSFVSRVDDSLSNETSVGQLREYFDWQTLGAFRRTNFPVLYAHGGMDEVLPTSLSAKACEELARTRNKVSYYFDPTADHTMQVSERGGSNAFFDAFREWVRGDGDSRVVANCPFRA